MIRKLLGLVLVVAAFPAYPVDRIQAMEHTERCIYRARLAAAGAYIRDTKKAKTCEEIQILWHGDETENEVELIKRWSCAGFESGKNPIATGDQMFAQCVKESDL